MNKLSSLCFLLLISCITARLCADTAKRAPIPGTRVSCIAPEGFSLSRGFVGLESIEYQTSILVMELPCPPTEDDVDFISFIKTHFNCQTLASQGLVLIKDKVVKIDGYEGIVFTTTQLVNAVNHKKLIIFFVEKDKTIFQIQITCPNAYYPDIEENLSNFISSIKVNETRFSVSLPYTLSLPAGWALAKQFGVMELYTETGTFPRKDDEQSFAVLNLHEMVLPSKRETWILSKNTKRNHYTNFKVISSESLKIDGLDANISVVDCQSLADQKELTKFCCYIFLKDTSFLLETEKGPRFSKQLFVDICKSWKLKKPEPSKGIHSPPRTSDG